MSSICVVMAVHNRLPSVHRALHSWSLQTQKNFTLVLADDGSIVDIAGLVKIYRDSLCILYCRREEGGNGPAVLNKGTLLAPQETTHIWYTDGDIIFNNRAMEAAYRHIEEHPNRVIAGRYDWMPPMDFSPSDLEQDFQKFVDCGFPHRGPGVPRRRFDHRVRGGRESSWFQHRLFDGCGAVLGANVIIPIQAWHDIGGWDEHIPGANANDCDFGWCLTDAGYRLLTCECIVGYHQWHPRDSRVLALYKVSLPYIFRKHGREVPDQWKPYDTYREV